MNINAEIISVGTEILLGRLINTNASYLSGRFAEMGVNVFYHSVVGDNPSRLSTALEAALRRSDIVVTTGGLGPTVDDITIGAISKTFSRPLVFNKNIAAGIKNYFGKKRVKMHPYVLRQAYVPKGARAFRNSVGTAPACVMACGKKTVIALPGPPGELVPAFERFVIPYIKERHKTGFVILTRAVRAAGAAESAVNRKIKNILAMDGAVKAGIYSRPGEVDIALTAKAESGKRALALIKKSEKKILRALGKKVYGFDSDTLEYAVGKRLLKKGLVLSTAESCTGGLLASRITDIPGSSRYFEKGVITYSDKSKIKELGVSEKIIKAHGAVSRPTARAMAEGLLEKSDSDIALALTGIAGPSGGTRRKPVGLVYIAAARKTKAKKTKCIERRFTGNRASVKRQAASAALDLLRNTL